MGILLKGCMIQMRSSANRPIISIYQDIASLIVDAINEDWSYAVIYIQFHGDAARFKARYETPKLSLESFDLHHTTLDLLEELDSGINPDNSKPWNRAKFNLEPDGEFEMKFAWDQDFWLLE